MLRNKLGSFELRRLLAIKFNNYIRSIYQLNFEQSTGESLGKPWTTGN